VPHRSYVSLFTLIALTALALAVPLAVPAQAPVAIPNSPAGTLLKQWLDAFNRADSAGLDAFDTAHNPRVNAVSAQNQLRLARASGGLELVRIISAEPSHIIFAARAKSGGTALRGNIEVMDGDPSQIKTFGVQQVPPGAPLEGCTTYTLPSTHGTSAADVASEDAIIAALFGARVSASRLGSHARPLCAGRARHPKGGDRRRNVWHPRRDTRGIRFGSKGQHGGVRFLRERGVARR
jgi:hypothetical protein